MRRRSSVHREQRISLFPFLAVLLCTMGALLVLLVVITRRAQASAAEQASEQLVQNEADTAEVREKFAHLQQRITEIRSQFDKVKEHRSQRRRELTHVEAHMQKLAEEFVQLRHQLEDLQRLDGSEQQDTDAMQRELQGLHEEIGAAQQRLRQHDLKPAQQVSFAVVPYEGQHRTNRRPIYIECRNDKILLQPEGLELLQSDFRGPQGPGNPLAATLRVASEYLSAKASRQGQVGKEPYPFLLVRPDGIMGFYKARSALSEWGSEIGYELIGEDWDLAFLPPDPQMASEMTAALEIARREMESRELYERRRGAHPGGSGEGSGSGGWGSGDRRGGGSGDGANEGTEAAGGSSEGGGDSELDNRGHGGPAAGARRDPGAIATDETNPTFGAPNANDAASGPGGGSTMRSLSDVRGADWALPDATQGAIPVDKVIIVQCHVNQLVILSRSANRPHITVPMSGSTRQTVDRFVSSIWDHMKGWGIAGRGLYWRPAITLQVLPGGERRAQELKLLLEGSGFEIEMK